MPGIMDSVHEYYVAGRRRRVLASLLAPLLVEGSRVLDVGCGDGALSQAILQRRPDLHIEGIEVLLRGSPHIRVSAYDGRTIPFPDESFDAVLLVDVLHHADDPSQLLREARRVATTCVLIKDHTADGVLALETLRFLDRVGNERHGVALPYRYWKQGQWRRELQEAGLSPSLWNSSLHLYPWPASLLFDRSLHFVARLQPV